MKIQSAPAIYSNGTLIFKDPNNHPKDGTNVMVVYVEDSFEKIPPLEALERLRGCARGEHLLETLLEERKRDRDMEEKKYGLINI